MIKLINDLVAEDIPSMSNKELHIVLNILKNITFAERYSSCTQKSKFAVLLLLVRKELGNRKEKGEKVYEKLCKS